MHFCPFLLCEGKLLVKKRSCSPPVIIMAVRPARCPIRPPPAINHVDVAPNTRPQHPQPISATASADSGLHRPRFGSPPAPPLNSTLLPVTVCTVFSVAVPSHLFRVASPVGRVVFPIAVRAFFPKLRTAMVREKVTTCKMLTAERRVPCAARCAIDEPPSSLDPSNDEEEEEEGMEVEPVALSWLCTRHQIVSRVHDSLQLKK